MINRYHYFEDPFSFDSSSPISRDSSSIVFHSWSVFIPSPPRTFDRMENGRWRTVAIEDGTKEEMDGAATFVRGCTSWWLAPPRRCPPPPLHTCGMGSTGNRKPSDKPAFIRARMIRQRDGQRCCWRWCCCCTPARSPRHVEAVD